jgi:hypothetical protein
MSSAAKASLRDLNSNCRSAEPLNEGEPLSANGLKRPDPLISEEVED